MAEFTKEAGAALVFAILYTLLGTWMAYGYAIRRYKFASRWSLLMFHVTIRIASQACGVAFGILAFSNTDLFIAYLILGAEGYFSLTLASFLFLRQYQQANLGWSFLAPEELHKPTAAERRKRIFEALFLIPVFMPWRYWRHHLMAIVHSVLIPSNAIIIAGGSILAGTTEADSGESAATLRKNEAQSKILRTVGSCLFYAMTVAFTVCLALSLVMDKRARRDGVIKRRSVHPTLLVLMAVALFVNVRGIFGILQSAISSLSYFSSSNYDSSGFTNRFTAIEYCLTVLPEFMCAFLLNLTYFTSKHDRDTAEVAREERAGRLEQADLQEKA